MRFLRWISPAKPKDKWLFVSLLIICLPFFYMIMNNYISYLALNIVFGIAVLAILSYDLVVSSITNKKLVVAKSYSFWFLVAFLLWLFVSSFFSINKVVTWSGVFNGKHVKESIWQYFCYFFFFCAARKTEKSNRYWLTSVMVWLMCLYILLGFIDMYAVPVPGYICDGNKYSLVFYHQNHSGYLATITAILSFYKFCSNETRKNRIPFIFAFFIHCVFLCCNGSLGPILAVIGVIAVCGIIHLARKNWQISKRMLVVVLVFVASFSLFDFVPKIKDARNDGFPLFAKLTGVFCNAVGIEYTYKIDGVGEKVSGSDGYARIPMWKDCLHTITEKPLFGTGISTFENKNPEYELANPHNEYLQYASSSGIPALLFYLAFAISIIVGVFKKKNRSLPFYNGCAYAIFGYLISAFFGCTMSCVMPQLFLLFGFADIGK